jgi:hypothetical protein
MTTLETTIESDEDVKGRNQFSAVLRAISKMILSPGTFYETLPRRGGYGAALLFLLACGAVFSLFANLYSGEHKIVYFLIYFLNAVFMPFVTAFILYLVSLLICKEAFPYQTLFRITAYANVTLLASWIQGLSWMLGIYNLYLIGLGMVKVGRITARRAFCALLAGLAILLLVIRFLQPMIKYG